MYRCTQGLIRTLELRSLELTLCFHSDVMSQYLEQTLKTRIPQERFRVIR